MREEKKKKKIDHLTSCDSNMPDMRFSELEDEREKHKRDEKGERLQGRIPIIMFGPGVQLMSEAK
jgi:hypothetical protein